MLSSRCIIIVIISAVAVGAAFAETPMQAPRVSCPPLAWTAAKTADPQLSDIETMRCWSRAGDPVASFILAQLQRFGRGMPADPGAARVTLQRLAVGNRKVGTGAMPGAMTSRNDSYGIIDGQLASVAEAKPYPPAMRELAKMLLLGHGGAKDVEGAMSWLRRAEAAKDIEAGVLLKALTAKGY